MNRESRRQATGPRPQRSRSRIGLESLETRQLLSGEGTINPDLIPSLLFRRGEHGLPPVGHVNPLAASPEAVAGLDNDGKVIFGQTTQGEEYVITVHGPGVAIVTDSTPNDGLLNSEIDSIQLIGTDINRTYVTGQVTASDRVISDGLLGFNRLTANDGVASIILNGFVLRETARFETGIPPRIALLGGVRELSFFGVEASNDLLEDPPVDIIIGDPTTPLRVRPNIRIDHIFNTAFDADAGLVEGVPAVEPSVRLLVNGVINNLSLVSATAQPVPADIEASVSPVAYTGRTSVQALGIEGLKFVGSARNVTFSRTGRPFSGGFSGMNRIGHAYFGGRADAVGIDATGGRIDRLRFRRGLGDPTGTRDTLLYAGIPLGERGYPWAGLSGGVVAARSIGNLAAGPADHFFRYPADPSLIQHLGPGTTNYAVIPGAALTNATIASSGSIGRTQILGNARNSLITSGFDYLAFRRGLEPTREPSRIGPYHQRGDLVDAVIAASYRPVDGIYGNANDLVGRGVISGRLRGNAYLGDLDNLAGPITGPPMVRGSGFFARRLIGQLPTEGGTEFPPARRRPGGVLVR